MVGKREEQGKQEKIKVKVKRLRSNVGASTGKVKIKIKVKVKRSRSNVGASTGKNQKQKQDQKQD